MTDLSVEDLKTSEVWREFRIQSELIDGNDMQFFHLVDNAEDVLPIIQTHCDALGAHPEDDQRWPV